MELRSSVWARRGAVAAVLIAVLPAAGAAMAALRPLEGTGNFLTTIDVLDRREADGTWSLVLLICAANRDLTFEQGEGELTGQLHVMAELTAEGGGGARLATAIAIRCADREQAASATSYQNFPLVLRGIGADRGRLTVSIEDRLRARPGKRPPAGQQLWARSEAAADWAAPEPLLAPAGLTLQAPVFLARAPIRAWSDEGLDDEKVEQSALSSYLHPGRRYGLEQDRLQVYFEVEAAPGALDAAPAELLVQVLAKDLDFALRDTIPLTQTQGARLSAGGATAVFYDLDVADLPPGVYQLSVAPGDGRGRGWLAEFDVVWRLESLNRFADELLWEGRVVLADDQREEFEAAGQAQREALLESFWSEHDPDPATPVNEAYQEFRCRVSYVREHLGGIKARGPLDARAELYLLLGPPDEISRDVLPLNERAREDALAQVYDRFALERHGTQIKGKPGIPLVVNTQTRRAILSKKGELSFKQGFELWEYNHAGRQLFPNRYSGQGLGMRFLLVDRFGVGVWMLDSTSVLKPGG